MGDALQLVHDEPELEHARGNHGPRLVRPGESFGGPVDWGEVKARAEIYRNKECSGGTMADVEAVYKDNRSATHVPKTGVLQNPSGHFFITIQ